jgi:ABC-type antimicrobial peptide transport system permease subunit
MVFSILSGATIILISYFDNFSRAGLLTHKGVVVKATDFGTAGALRYSDAIGDIGSISEAEETIFYRYINFGSSLRIFSVNTNYPWAFQDLKPNDLVAGHFPQQSNQPIITADPDNREWMFVTESAFNSIVYSANLNLEDSDIFVHSITVIAAGDVFNGAAYANVDLIEIDLRVGLTSVSTSYDNPIFTRQTDKDETRNMMFLSLTFGIIGTFMVSTLYSYLITRFRRREVAVLKAMGYNKWSVRIVVLSEILVVAVTGFLIGLLAIQAYLYFSSTSSYVFYIIFSPTALLSFLAVVLSCVPGFLLITTRILGVRPLEIFRQK